MDKKPTINPIISLIQLGVFIYIFYVLFTCYQDINEISNPVKGNINYEISAYSIAKEFEENEVRAMNKYKDKVIHIYGEIKDFNTSLVNNYPAVTLKGYKYKDVHLSFTKSTGNYIKNKSKGDSISAVCVVSSDIGELFLHRCR